MSAGHSAESEGRTSRLLLLSAIPAVLLFAWLVALGYAMQVDPDEGVYKVIEVGIFDGKWPYRDLFTNRQPMTFLWYLPYGLGASISVQRIFAAASMAASVPLVAIAAGRWFGPDRRLMAAIVYAFLLANPLLAVRGNVEAYLLPLLVGAIVVSGAVPAGLLFGLAISTKLHALVFAPVFFLVWRRDLPAFALAAAAVCAAVSLPFVPIWSDYWVANIDFAFTYADYTSGDRLQTLSDVQWFIIIAGLPLWAAAGIGAVLSGRRPALLVFGFCGLVSVKASGYDYNHYYALVIPPLALLATEGLLYVHRRRALRYVFAPIAAAGLLIFGMSSYREIRDADVEPYEELAVEALADKPGELYMLGDRSEFYVYVGRQPQRRFFFSIPLVMDERWGEETRADLLACPPAVLLVPLSGSFVVPWLEDVQQRYTQRENHEFGSVFSDPIPPTANAEPGCP